MDFCGNCGDYDCNGMMCDTASQICCSYPYQEPEPKILALAKIPGHSQLLLVGKTAEQLAAEKLAVKHLYFPGRYEQNFEQVFGQTEMCEKTYTLCGCVECEEVRKQANVIASRLPEDKRETFYRDVILCKIVNLDAFAEGYSWKSYLLSSMGIRI